MKKTVDDILFGETKRISIDDVDRIEFYINKFVDTRNVSRKNTIVLKSYYGDK